MQALGQVPTPRAVSREGALLWAAARGCVLSLAQTQPGTIWHMVILQGCPPAEWQLRKILVPPNLQGSGARKDTVKMGGWEISKALNTLFAIF